MAKYGGDDVVVEFDNSSGTLVTITSDVISINGIKKGAVLVDGTTFGKAWKDSLDSGLRELSPINIEMFYDDTSSTGTWVLFNDIGGPTPTDGREFKVTFGSTKTFLVKTIIESVERQVMVGELHKIVAVLKHFGGSAPTEA